MKLIGHQKQWHFLKKSVETGRISHAYLFWGQPQLGKRTIAKEFVKLVNCQEAPRHFFSSSSDQTNFTKSGGGCQACWSCQAFQKEIHPDLIFIRPEGKEIKISQIRELQHKLSLRPHSSIYKGAILEAAERISKEAQSCLLKTLEEPPKNTLLVLITEYPETLFPTILSRVQRIKFSPISKIEVENYLKSQKISSLEIQRIASLSFGRPGLVIDFLKNPQELEKEYQKVKEVSEISQQDISSRFRYVKKLISREEDPKGILESWLRYFQDILRVKTGLTPELKIFSLPDSAFPVAKIKKIINYIEEINFLISSTNINSRLALESLMLQF